VIAQNAIFVLMMSRTGGPAFPGRPPNNFAAILAADVGSALAADPQLDVDAYLRREYARARPLFVMMKDGRVASNGADALSDAVRASIDAALHGRTFDGANEPRIEGPPTVSAPIQVGDELRGMVAGPWAGGVVRRRRRGGRPVGPATRRWAERGGRAGGRGWARWAAPWRGGAVSAGGGAARAWRRRRSEAPSASLRAASSRRP